VPGPPLGLTAGDETMDSITLDWRDPDLPNGDIKFYEICHVYKVYPDLSDSSRQCENTTFNDTRYTVNNLTMTGN